MTEKTAGYFSKLSPRTFLQISCYILAQGPIFLTFSATPEALHTGYIWISWGRILEVGLLDFIKGAPTFAPHNPNAARLNWDRLLTMNRIPLGSLEDYILLYFGLPSCTSFKGACSETTLDSLHFAFMLWLLYLTAAGWKFWILFPAQGLAAVCHLSLPLVVQGLIHNLHLDR